MKTLLALAALFLAACSATEAHRSLPEGCRYPGSSVECRGLQTG